jgi:pimeloyl-[acyl-carrier protein] methyl ester esterase
MTRTIWSETRGGGQDLVLIHGWGMNASVWGDVPDILAENFRVTCMDLPGHGRSRNQPLGSLPVVAEELAAVVPDESVILGWSLGGLLAIELASSFPGKTKKLLLVNSSPCFVRRDNWPPALDAEVFAAFEQGLKDDYSATLRRFLGLQLQGVADARELIRVLRRKLEEAPPEPDALRQGLRLLCESDLRSRLLGLEIPVAALLGARDTLVPGAVAEALGSECGVASVEVIPDGAHIPFLTHPELFVDWVMRHGHD